MWDTQRAERMKSAVGGGGWVIKDGVDSVRDEWNNSIAAEDIFTFRCFTFTEHDPTRVCDRPPD